MNFLDQNYHETSNLSNSESSSHPIQQIPFTKLFQDLQNFPSQQRALPPVLSTYENNIVGGKSNYSSINNILPCPDGDNSGCNSRKHGECSKTSDKTHFSSITFQDNPSLRSLEAASSKQKTSLENSLNMEKTSLKVSTRPPLNPTEVARGLSSLHQKVDDLLKKHSQVRASSVQNGERSQRAASIETRTPTNYPQTFTLSPAQPETADIVSNRNSVPANFAFPRIPDLSQFSSAVLDHRDNTPQVRSSNFPISPYQDLILKDKTLLNTPKPLSSPKSESKELKSAFHTEIARNYTDTKYMRRQEPNIPHSVPNPLRESIDTRTEEYKPKYDEKRLDAILSRIRERSSVGSAPRQRSSVTLQEADTSLRLNSAAVKVSWSTSKKNQEIFNERKETGEEERVTAIPINWQLSQIVPDEKSIDEIPVDKDMNMTGNTTILELFNNKRSMSSPKFREEPPEDENGHRNPVKANKMTPGEKRLRLTVPKIPGGNISSATPPTVYLQDILRDLQAEKPVKAKEINKDRVEVPKNIEIQPEKAKNMMIYQNLDLKEKSLNTNTVGYRVPVLMSREDQEEEGIRKRGTEVCNQSPEVKKSSKYFASEEEEASMRFKYQTNPRQKSVDASRQVNQERKSVKNIFELKKEEPLTKLTIDRGRTLEAERKPQRFQRVSTQAVEPSPSKKTEEDSLALDDSVFSVKEGGVHTHRKINVSETKDKSTTKENSQVRNDLDTTTIRKNFLEEDANISDFDFDKNRLDTQEAERSRTYVRNQGLEDSCVDNLSLKVLKGSGKKGKQYEDLKLNIILPKAVEAPKNKVLGRAV